MAIIDGPLDPLIVDADEYDAVYFAVYTPLAQSGGCFLCGEMSYPIVYWVAQGGSLFLCADCAVELGCHLIKDGIVARKPRTSRAGRVPQAQ